LFAFVVYFEWSGCKTPQVCVIIQNREGLLQKTDRQKRQPAFAQRIAVCHACDAIHTVPVALARREVAYCSFCHAVLHHHLPDNALERCLSLHLSALILFVIANLFPFITLELNAQNSVYLLLSGPSALFIAGNFDVATLVLMVSIVFPLLTMLGALYLLIFAYFGMDAPGKGAIYRLVHRLMPWSMLGVFMLGVIIAVVKLHDMAQLEFGIAMTAFIVMLPTMILAQQYFDSSLFWPPQGQITDADRPLHGRAQHHGLLHCHTCSYLVRQSGEEKSHRCPRCADRLHLRKPNSLTRTKALLVTGIMLFIPANLFPIMTIAYFGHGEPSTILGGVSHLVASGMWPLALIVFFASIMVPISKFVGIIFLLSSVRRESAWRPEDRTRLYRVLETIGSWSMVDVFVIALLTALVQFDGLTTIYPGIAASFFAATVVVTMLATESFDPRLMWDALEDEQKSDQIPDPIGMSTAAEEPLHA